jgi:hypothetical protein
MRVLFDRHENSGIFARSQRFRERVEAMANSMSRGVTALLTNVSFALVLFSDATGQLVYQQKMEKHSAILPLTLDNDVYRIRAKPPSGVSVRDIKCDVGITGTMLNDQRGTSAVDPGEKVVGDLWSRDDIDVYFTDRVNTDLRDLAGNRIIGIYNFDCGINIKYKNLNKVAQLEIRPGYVLPSGDIEGLTWMKIRRKKRLYEQNIAKCGVYRQDIANLQAEYNAIAGQGANAVERTRIAARMSGIQRLIRRRELYVSREQSFRADLAAFVTIEEYLKTKVNGCQIFVHFHHDGNTLAVDVDDLKRSRIRPIQVFEYAKDPIRHPSDS